MLGGSARRYGSADCSPRISVARPHKAVDCKFLRGRLRQRCDCNRVRQGALAEQAAPATAILATPGRPFRRKGPTTERCARFQPYAASLSAYACLQPRLQRPHNRPFHRPKQPARAECPRGRGLCIRIRTAFAWPCRRPGKHPRGGRPLQLNNGCFEAHRSASHSATLSQ
jgi:hypothetical protein